MTASFIGTGEELLLTASEQDQQWLLSDRELWVPDLLVAAASRFRSTLAIEDGLALGRGADNSTVASLTIRPAADSPVSQIQEGGRLLLNSNTYQQAQATLTLQNQASLVIQSQGTLQWERGVVGGQSDGAQILVQPQALLYMPAPSGVEGRGEALPLRVLDGVDLDMQGDWTLTPNLSQAAYCASLGLSPREIFDVVPPTKPPLPSGGNSTGQDPPEGGLEPEPFFGRIELLVNTSLVSLTQRARLNVGERSTSQNRVLFDNGAQLRVTDQAQIEGGLASWSFQGKSTYNQSDARVSLHEWEVFKSLVTLQGQAKLEIAREGSMSLVGHAHFRDQAELTIIEGSQATVHHSIFRLSEQATLKVAGSSSFSLDTTGTPFLVKDAATLVAEEGSSMEFIGSVKLANQSSLFVRNDSRLSVVGVRRCDVPETYTCYCHCNDTSSHTQVCGAGVDRGSCLSQCVADGLACSPSQPCARWGCDGFCETTCATGYNNQDARLLFENESRSTIRGSLFDVALGFINLSERHRFQLYDSELKIQDGNFTAQGESTLDFVEGQLEVSGGGIFFSEASRIRAVNGSELEVAAGKIEIQEDSLLLMVASQIEIGGGELAFGGHSKFSSSGGASWEEGELDGLGDVEDGTMHVEISAGRLLFTETSRAEFLDETSVSVYGTFQVSESSHVVSQAATIDVYAEPRCPQPVWRCECACTFPSEERSSAILCAPGLDGEVCEGLCKDSICDPTTEECEECVDSCVDTCPQGLVTVAGSVLLEGQSRADLIQSTLTLHEGSLQTTDQHALYLEEATVLLSQGHWTSSRASSVDLVQSSLRIEDGGQLIFTEDSRLSQQGGEVEVLGQVLLEGASVEVNQAMITVGQGALTFAQQVRSSFQQSQVQLTGEGNIYLQAQAQATFANSSVEIRAGTMFLSGLSQLDLQSGSRLDVFSSLWCRNQTRLSMEGSVVQVGGRVDVSDRTQTYLVASEMHIGSVHGAGDILVSQEALWSVQNTSLVTLTGDLRLQHQAQLEVRTGSAVVVEGNGILSLKNESVLRIQEGSLVSVAQGTVRVEGQARIEVTGDSQLVANDIMDLTGTTQVYLPPGNQFRVEPQGVLMVQEYLEIATLWDGSQALPSLQNQGILDLRQARGATLYVPLENEAEGLVGWSGEQFRVQGMRNAGRMFFGGSSIQFTNSSSLMNTTTALQMNTGSQAQGILQLEGDLENEGALVHDESTGTHFNISGHYRSSSQATLYITILDTRQAGMGYTLMHVGQSAQLGGRVEICIPASARLSVDRLDVIQFGSLVRQFDEVVFQCSPSHYSPSYEQHATAKRAGHPVSHPKQVEASSDTSCMSTSYTSRSFTVLLGGCGNGGNDYFYSWLSLGFVGGAILLMLVLVVVYEVPPIRHVLLGKEGARIERVRRVQRSLPSWNLENTV